MNDPKQSSSPEVPSDNNPTPARVIVGEFTASDSQQSDQHSQPASEPQLGITGSSMQPEKQTLPKGVYAIVAFIALGIIASFFDTSQLSLIYSITLVVNLVLAAGLLLKLEAARKLLVIIAIISTILFGVTFLLLVGLQQRVNDAIVRYDAAISRLDEQKLTFAQRQQLDTLNEEVVKTREQTGKAIVYSYTVNGVYAVLHLAIVIYLTRPKVKQAFEKMKT